MRSAVIVVLCLAQLACSDQAIYTIQTDGSLTPPPMHEPLRLPCGGNQV